MHSSDPIWKFPSASLFSLPSTCHWVMCYAFQITCQNVSSKASIQIPPLYDSFPRFSWFSIIWKSIWRCVPVKSTACQVPALPPTWATSMMFNHVLIFSHMYLSHNSCLEMIIAFPPQVITGLKAKWIGMCCVCSWMKTLQQALCNIIQVST